MIKFFANGYTRSGVPDLLVCCNGFFLGVELKASNGTPSALQLYNREEIRRSKGISIVLYPHQFEEFKSLIDELIKFPQHINIMREKQKTFDRKER